LTLTIANNLKKKRNICQNESDQLTTGTKLPSEISSTVEILSAGTHMMREWLVNQKVANMINQLMSGLINKK
jgi:hypothetical protein